MGGGGQVAKLLRTSIIDTRVQFDHNRSANDLLQKVTRGLLPQAHFDCDLKGWKMSIRYYSSDLFHGATLA